jgi:tetratricopeptide (TPR) repeat protein/CHAT domain-containing protein
MDLVSKFWESARYQHFRQIMKATFLVLWVILGLWPAAVLAQYDQLNEAHNKFLALYQQGHYSEAEPYGKEALRLAEEVFGPNEWGTAKILNNLALLYSNQGRYAEAEPLFMRAIGIEEKAFGPEHLEVATSLNNLATLYQNQGRYEESEPLMKRALNIFEKALGPEHPNVATSLNNLAGLYQDQGRYAEAEPLYQRSLAIQEKVLGPEHPDVAISLQNLAGLFQDQGRHEEAEPLMKRAISIGEKVLGPEHPDVAGRLNNLGTLYQDQGRYEEAEPLYMRALNIFEKSLGPEHPDVVAGLSNLAGLYYDQGRSEEAELLMKRALSIDEKAFGPEHPKVATRLNNLGVLYQNQGRYEEAEPLLKRALSIKEKFWGPDHPDLAEGFNNLALLYSNQGRYADAEPLYMRALDVFETVFGPEHPDVATTLSNLGLLYSYQGRSEEAELLMKRALSIDEKAFGPEHPDVAARLFNLAYLHWLKGHLQDAIRLVRQAVAIHRQRASRLTGQLSEGNESEQQSVRFVFLRHLAIASELIEEDTELRDGLVAESFEVAQLARVSAASTAVAGMAARFAAGDDALARVVRERQDTISRLQRLDNQLVSALSRPSEERDVERERSVRAEIGLLSEGLTEFDERLKTDFPDYAEIANPQPVPLPEVQGLLGSEEVLISFMVWDEYSFMLVVRDDRAEMFKLEVGADALRVAVKLMRLYLAPQGLTGVTDLLQRGYPGTKAFELYLNLIAPAEPLLQGARHLFVVPDGELQSLPLGVLLTEEPRGDFDSFDAYRRAPWLARKYAITALPSVSSLRALRRYAKGSKATKPFIGFGDPVLASGADNSRGIEISSVFRGHEADLEAIRQLPSLPETADELKDIARTLGADESAIFLGTNATEAQVRAAPLADSRVLAFATHALVGGEIEGAAEPALVLTPPKVATDDDDGLLTASEIAKHLTLNADWVILSACNTAAGETPEAEGLSGLAKAFFYAGSRALLVSHWPVPSKSAVKLTTGTFAALAADPEIGRAEALQKSMMALLEDTETDYFAHPFFWAPFVVVGEGGRVGHP